MIIIYDGFGTEKSHSVQSLDILSDDLHDIGCDNITVHCQWPSSTSFDFNISSSVHSVLVCCSLYYRNQTDIIIFHLSCLILIEAACNQQLNFRMIFISLDLECDCMHCLKLVYGFSYARLNIFIGRN